MNLNQRADLKFLNICLRDNPLHFEKRTIIRVCGIACSWARAPRPPRPLRRPPVAHDLRALPLELTITRSSGVMAPIQDCEPHDLNTVFACHATREGQTGMRMALLLNRAATLALWSSNRADIKFNIILLS